MSFQLDKQRFLDKLYKPDKSKKGDVDEHIISLIDTINKSSNYYTTSSCSGRIVLITQPKSGKKNEAHWHYVSHELAEIKEVFDACKKFQPDEEIWFRMEGAIIHVCARDIESASLFLKMCKGMGIKRSGIYSITEERIIIEAMTPEHIETPIYRDGKMLVTEEYIEQLILEANKKLEQVWEKIKLLNQQIFSFP